MLITSLLWCYCCTACCTHVHSQWGSGGSGTGPADQQNPPTEPNTPWSTTASSRQKASDEAAARRSRSPTPTGTGTGSIAAAVFTSKVFSDQSAAAPPQPHSHARQPTALMAEANAGNSAARAAAEIKRQNASSRATRQSLVGVATSPTGRVTSYSAAQRSPVRAAGGSSFAVGVAALAAAFGGGRSSGGGSVDEIAAAAPAAAAGRQHRHKDSSFAQDRYLKAIAPTAEPVAGDAPVGGAVLGTLSGGGARRHSDGAAGQQAKAMEEEAAAAAEAAAAGATAAAAVVASRASSRQLLAGRSRSTMDPEDVQFSDVSCYTTN
jgi:hypothetical protein